MRNLAGRFLAAWSAGMAGSALIALIPLCNVAAAEECLTRPKVETPAGKHWYYRIERGTKRECWYLRERSETAHQVATSKSISLAAPDVEPDEQTELARSAADAHAELPPQNMVEKQLKTGRSAQTTSASLRGPELSLSKNASAEAVYSPVIARWPDLSGTFSSANGPASSSVAIVSAAPNAGLDVSVQPNSASKAPPVAPTKVKTAANVPTVSLQMLLLGTFGAVAFCWLLRGSLTARRLRRRRRPVVAWPREEPGIRTSIPAQTESIMINSASGLDPRIKAGSPSSGHQRGALSDDSRQIVQWLARFANQEPHAERG